MKEDREMLASNHTVLRPLEPPDMPLVCSWMNTPQIARGLLRAWPMNTASGQDWYEQKKKSIHHLLFAIEDNADHAHVGIIALQNIHWVHRTAEIWIVIGDVSRWGKGFAFEAVETLKHYSFATLAIRKLYLHVSTSNPAAIAVYKKAGFVEEGKFTREYFIDNAYVDVLRMATFSS